MPTESFPSTDFNCSNFVNWINGVAGNSALSEHELDTNTQAANEVNSTFVAQRFMTDKDISFSDKRFSAQRNKLRDQIFGIGSNEEFRQIALEVFRYQFDTNIKYRTWSEALNRNPSNVHSIEHIPFLPIRYFKESEVKCGEQEAELVFSSSGTTGVITSRHYIYDSSLYRESILRGFERAYGRPSEYCILGLLPSYLERAGSSLVWMTELLINESKHPDSGFYLYNHDELNAVLHKHAGGKHKIWLIGVSFALLDFALTKPAALPQLRVVETGGMKGRRREMIREELHAKMRETWTIDRIDSEYGMTELLSQGWMLDEKYFNCPHWMKVLMREVDNPLNYVSDGRTGGINAIDLANLDSCAFIETADLGRCIPGKGFEVLGRIDHSEARGCNLLVI